MPVVHVALGGVHAATDLRGLDREVVERYLAELGRQNRLENGQFRQVVDAMWILVLDLSVHDWAKAIDWPFWRGIQKEVDKNHATLVYGVSSEWH